jgi:predicted nucleotidyltransferase component of viral defense system
MILSRQRLQTEAAQTGFRAEILEKVARLLALLEALRSHPYLKGRLALKGGTALNLFLFDVPRLSVDIDLNYVGAADRETMLAERPGVAQAVEAVCQREGMAVVRVPEEHAGGKWRARYESALGGGANIEIDINFMYRAPLWPVSVHDSRPVGSFEASRIPLVDVHEIAAGKLAALFARRAGRDLFDAHILLTRQHLDQARLRAAFVAIGAMNRKDWRTIRIENVGFDGTELEHQLLPLLRQSQRIGPAESEEWARGLVEACRKELERLLPFTDAEREFLDRLLDRGEIVPSLITPDAALADRIARHPLLGWKAQNVRKHKEQA